MQNFVSKVMTLIGERLGNGYIIRTDAVTKNNGKRLQGLVIMNGETNISPTIYLEKFFYDYQRGRNLEDIVNEVIHIYNASLQEVDFDVSAFKDFQKIKGQIFFTLINRELNKEFLTTIPHIKYLDFAIIFKVLYESPTLGTASITINNTHLELWNTTLEEIYNLAKENSPYLLPCSITNMLDVISEILPESEEDFSNATLPMYVITNDKNFYGCGCILYPDVLSNLSYAIGHNLYLLPCSTHEMIILPDNNMDPKYLSEMVYQVNSEAVSEEEFLSNNIYYYSRNTKNIEIVAL